MELFTCHFFRVVVILTLYINIFLIYSILYYLLFIRTSVFGGINYNVHVMFLDISLLAGEGTSGH